MAGNIYLIRNEQDLVPLEERRYDSEALLQRLLADHPALLAGEQLTDGAPRRWLLVSREIPLSVEAGSASWYVDHLYLDQDGVPTLVEVKRSTDSRIRREVVGQMLDYAANAVVRWSVEQLRARFDADPAAAERLQQFLEGASADEFWQIVGANLAGGRIRMVFVADEIPPELRRVVDFLASQLSRAEVYAVEVRNFESAGLRALVPRLVSTPKSSPTTTADRQWDEGSFFDELRRNRPASVDAARSIHRWASQNMTDFWYGKGTTQGSCYPRLILPNSRLLLFALWTYGTVEMQFQHMRVPPFDDVGQREKLIEMLNRIPGVAIPAEASRRRPSFDLALLAGEPERDQFLAAMSWAIEQVRRG